MGFHSECVIGVSFQAIHIHCRLCETGGTGGEHHASLTGLTGQEMAALAGDSVSQVLPPTVVTGRLPPQAQLGANEGEADIAGSRGRAYREHKRSVRSSC